MATPRSEGTVRDRKERRGSGSSQTTPLRREQLRRRILGARVRRWSPETSTTVTHSRWERWNYLDASGDGGLP